MFLRCLLVLHYLFFCCRYLTIPWRYFQLNARYFNDRKKIFSKQDLDAITPPEWRLAQYLDQADILPLRYPVFAKPEWGQNSAGVCCIRNLAQLKQLRSSVNYQQLHYLIQEAATGSIEFEVFIVKHPQQTTQYAVLSITQVVNDSEDKFPINGIYNKATSYADITAQFSPTMKAKLWRELSRMGDFTIARYSLKSDSLAALMQLQFKLVEVNLFVPMPLSLLSNNLSIWPKYQLLVSTTNNLAQLARQLNRKPACQHIFLHKLLASRHAHQIRTVNHNENNKAANLQMDQS